MKKHLRNCKFAKWNSKDAFILCKIIKPKALFVKDGLPPMLSNYFRVQGLITYLNEHSYHFSFGPSLEHVEI
jgi:hypothetical protein